MYGMSDKVERLAEDFKNGQGPFDSVVFPEERLVRELGDEHKVEYLSAFCTWDYNRSVDQLVENILQLNKMGDGHGTNHFDPESVVGVPLDELQAQFSSIGFRYPNRDAKGWQENCQRVNTKYGGSWGNVIEASNHNAPALVQVLRDDGFSYIKGKKLAPFYSRVVNDLVEPLDDLWELDIPVDVHVRDLTREILRKDMTDDEIRAFWREWGNTHDVSPAIVDGGLWQVGYNWDDWGRDYFEDISGRDTFTHKQ